MTEVQSLPTREARMLKMRDAAALTDADVAYVRTNFSTLAEVCEGRPETPEEVRSAMRHGLLPRPSYLLADDTEMVPSDYFVLVDAAGGPVQLREYFRVRCPKDAFEEIWAGYLSGVYGVCLVTVTPENILRKGDLVEVIEALLEQPQMDSSDWRTRLKAAVGELAGLERPFSPDFDRVAFGRPPTRDLLIEEPRRRFAEAFAE